MASAVPLTQREPVTIEVVLRDAATSAALRVCAYKRNEPEDSPPIALHLCSGALKIGNTVLTEAQLIEIINNVVGDDSQEPDDTLPNYSEDGTQVLAHVNGLLQWVDVDTSSCGGTGGGGGMFAGGAGFGGDIVGGQETQEEGQGGVN